MCSVATLNSDEQTDTGKHSLLEFHPHKPSLFISSDTKCSSANYKSAAVPFLTGSFLCTRKTLLNIGRATVTQKCIF